MDGKNNKAFIINNITTFNFIFVFQLTMSIFCFTLAEPREAGNIYLNVNGSYFKFIDVAGDGDCFYHSILKNINFYSTFKCVRELRAYLQKQVSNLLDFDVNLYKIFQYHDVDINQWLHNIVSMHKWSSNVDVNLFCYIAKWNVIIVGNYMNGFVVNNHYLELNNILNLQSNILTNGTIHMLFHKCNHPLERTRIGNHYAYLEPLSTPPFHMEMNSIKMQSIFSSSAEYQNSNHSQKQVKMPKPPKKNY